MDPDFRNILRICEASLGTLKEAHTFEQTQKLETLLAQVNQTVQLGPLGLASYLGSDKLFERGITNAGLVDLALSVPDDSLRSIVSNIAGTGILPQSVLAELELNIPKVSLLDTLERYHLSEERFRQFALGIATTDEIGNLSLNSLPALAEIQGIGQLVTSLPGFDDDLTKALRTDLGDWRQPLEVDFDALLDPAFRTEFYLSKGLAQEIVDLPEATFNSGMDSAGLTDDEPLVDEPHGETSESDFQRTNAAHNQLMRFEHDLRQFTDKLMSNTHGRNWLKHRVPGNVLQKWKDKKRADSSGSAHAQPLIAYADLNDILVIITKRDNWAEIFETFFEHRSSVEESFRRISPIRNCAMHARLITSEDLLYLRVEIMRLRKAFSLSH